MQALHPARTHAHAIVRSLIVACALLWTGCASTIPENRFGVRRLEIEGAEEMHEQAIRACLATRERARVGDPIGPAAECGEPPFDDGPLRWPLFSWPWTQWPLFDDSVFERDLRRIERWYRARGYYDARVTSVEYSPDEVLSSDRVPDDAACREEDDEGCEMRVRVTVREGAPVTMPYQPGIVGLETLPSELQTQLRQTATIEVGQRFDEADYDRTKEAIAEQLFEAAYAHAQVSGHVSVDRGTRQATVQYEVKPGKPCRFASVTVETEDPEAPKTTIIAAAGIDPGTPFSPSVLSEAQLAVYSLGAFSSVEVFPEVPPDGSTDIPVVIRVATGRAVRFGLGAGVLAGQLDQEQESTSVQRWDVHLLAAAEYRHLGSLIRVRVEERPKLIFDGVFPNPNDPRLGNEVRLDARWPAFIEPRTTLVLDVLSDLGPDPFADSRYFRHDLTTSLGPQRTFFGGRLFVGVRLRANLLSPLDKDTPEQDVPPRSLATLLEETIRFDQRDDPRSPTSGYMLSLGLQQAGPLPISSWEYFRYTPEVRGYLPLPGRLVFALRASAGFMVVTQTNLDGIDGALGPTRFRLRGGGATSNRGYLPGELGSTEGGVRRWEANAELRWNLGADFGLVAFADTGDVNIEPRFRFDKPNLSVGGGLRYYTAIGPLRLDIGARIPSLNRDPGAGMPPAPGPIDADAYNPTRDEAGSVRIFGLDFDGAVHLTIGEAF